MLGSLVRLGKEVLNTFIVLEIESEVLDADRAMVMLAYNGSKVDVLNT